MDLLVVFLISLQGQNRFPVRQIAASALIRMARSPLADQLQTLLPIADDGEIGRRSQRVMAAITERSQDSRERAAAKWLTAERKKAGGIPWLDMLRSADSTGRDDWGWALKNPAPENDWTGYREAAELWFSHAIVADGLGLETASSWLQCMRERELEWKKKYGR